MLYLTHAHRVGASTEWRLQLRLNITDNERYDTTIIITIIIHVIKINNKELQLQKQLIDTNGWPLAESIGQQHHLVGKWLMADCSLTWPDHFFSFVLGQGKGVWLPLHRNSVWQKLASANKALTSCKDFLMNNDLRMTPTMAPIVKTALGAWILHMLEMATPRNQL